MNFPNTIDVGRLVALTRRYEQENKIDPISNLARHKNYIFHGTLDTTVRPAGSQKLRDFYTQIGSPNIFADLNRNAQHAMITDDYGNLCTYLGTPWINNCNHALAGEILKYMYGNLNGTVTPIDANLMMFNQNEFTSTLGTRGLIYVPNNCKAQQPCKLHVVFHGCQQFFDSIGDRFAKNAGYNKWAENNNIIILYPQTKNTIMPMNPNGCFDWWGYTNANAFVKDGEQMNAVKKMIDRIMRK